MTTGATSIAAPERRRPLVERLIRRVLTHPAVLRIKVPVRDLVWNLKGRGVVNPPVPQEPRSIVFVCLGNICRSPFAGYLAARRLAAAGIDSVTCTSVGLRPSQAARSPREACAASTRYGISLDTHVPMPFTDDVAEKSDLIVVMEAAQVDAVRARYPQHADRIVLLSLFDPAVQRGHARYNIADPFGHAPAAFDACYERIDRALAGLLRAAYPRCRA